MRDGGLKQPGRFGKLPWLSLSVLVFVLDQLSKLYFEGALTLYQQIVLIPDYFSWTLAYNTGAAFSFLADADGWQRWFFISLSVLVVVPITVLCLLQKIDPAERWIGAGVAAGGGGNLIDRVQTGAVVDFLDVH